MFAPVCCIFSLLRFPFFRCGCSHLRQLRVSGFPSCCLCAASAFDRGGFPCFLYDFFLVSFPSVGRFVCHYIRLSRCWFTLVLPFCEFRLHVLFFPVRLFWLEFRSPYSLIGCSDFSLTLSVFSLGYWLCLFFSLFFFLVCLSSGVSASVRQRFSCLSVVLFYRTVSLHAAFLFLLPFQLVRSCFGTSLPTLRFVCLGRIFLLGFYLLSQLLSSVLSPSLNNIPLLVCAHCFRLLLPHFWYYFSLSLFSFCVHLSSLRCFVSCFFILAPYAAWLPASLSF